MRLPRILARFNRYVTNPIQRHWAGVIPLHGIIGHTGRRSGRPYRTPVLTFRTAGGFVFLAGYGANSDWVRNVLAAGGAELTHRRRRYVLSEPRLLRGAQGWALLPRPVRPLARLVRIEAVLAVTAASPAG